MKSLFKENRMECFRKLNQIRDISNLKSNIKTLKLDKDLDIVNDSVFNIEFSPEEALAYLISENYPIIHLDHTKVERTLKKILKFGDI